MDRWGDADDGIRNGMDRVRYVNPVLGGFVKKSSLEASSSSVASVEVVPSKKEQRRQHESKQMPPPPPPSKLSSMPNSHDVPGLPPLPDLPSWISGPVPDGFHIQVVKDGVTVQEISIGKTVTVLGRAQAVDVVLDHQSISRMHAAICVQGATGKLFLIDLGAVHGTFAAGKRLSKGVPEELSTGQELRFGASTRRYILQRHAPVQKRSLHAGIEEGRGKRVRFAPKPDSDPPLKPQGQSGEGGRFADLVEAPKIIPSKQAQSAPTHRALPQAAPSHSRPLVLDRARSDQIPSTLYESLPPAKS